MGVEEFFDWLNDIDRFFDVMSIHGSKQVKMVAIRLKSIVVVLWDRLDIQRRRQENVRFRVISATKNQSKNSKYLKP